MTEVRRGYKQTEVGVIPEDWDATQFRQVVQLYIDYRGRTPRKLGMLWGGGDILALSANNVLMGRIDPDKEAYVGSDELYRRWMVHGDCEQGDVLLTMEAPLGNVAQIPDGRKYILSQRVLLIRSEEWLSRDFLAYQMKASAFQKQLTANSTGTTAKGIQRRKLDDLWIAAPAEAEEQEAIAEALSDADALIESLEQLLTKKRQIKQGAMQDLLTGKKRLPGFESKPGFKQMEVGPVPEDWDVARLDAITDCLDNLRVPLNESQRAKRAGDIPYCGANGVLDHIDAFVVDDDIILMAEDGGYFDEYRTRPIAYRMTGKCWVNNHAHILKAKPGSNQGFLFYSLVHKNILRYLASGTRAKLNRSEMNKIEIPLPMAEAEQAAIASVLSDMDSELSLIETKLAKARQVKQGMMQELLTGRIRLV